MIRARIDRVKEAKLLRFGTETPNPKTKPIRTLITVKRTLRLTSRQVDAIMLKDIYSEISHNYSKIVARKKVERMQEVVEQMQQRDKVVNKMAEKQ